MKEHESHAMEGDQRKRFLSTYLRDHTAGAEHAIQLSNP